MGRRHAPVIDDRAGMLKAARADTLAPAMGGSGNSQRERAIGRHRARGKLLARERVELLIDPASALLELSPEAARGMYGDEVPAAGIVTAIASICGRLCMIVANDATVKGGTYFPISVRKHLRAQQIAADNHLPCVYLVDSGGAHLPLQAQMFADADHGGRFFANQARMSAAGIAQVACVMGSCTAGGAYVPAICDETVIVRGTGTIFLAGPPLVKAATGEDVSAEELGGADVHARISGVADHIADSDHEALARVREIVAHLPHTTGPAPWSRVDPHPPAASDREADLAGLRGARLVDALADEGTAHAFKPEFGAALHCTLARLCGYEVGIVASDGELDARAATRATHFLELCDTRAIPVVLLVDDTGVDGAATRELARLAEVASSIRVPALTVVAGNGRGRAADVLCPRASDPRFLWSWPQATYGHDASGAPLDATWASARVLDDGIAQPDATRDVLALCLAACGRAPLPARAERQAVRL